MIDMGNDAKITNIEFLISHTSRCIPILPITQRGQNPHPTLAEKAEKPSVVDTTADPNITIRNTLSLPKRLAASLPRMEAGTASKVTVEAIVPIPRESANIPE